MFDLNGETYAVDIQLVQEIIRYVTPRTVAGTDHAVRGVINLRGKIIPVCDLKARLGLEEVLDSQNAKIVIVETEIGVAGMIVDEVAEVLTIGATELDDVPEYAGHAPFVTGVAKIGDRLIVLIDPSSLFAIPLGDEATYAAAA